MQNKLIIQILLIRIKQLFRSLKEGGLIRVIFLFGFIAFAMFYIYNLLSKNSVSYFVLSGIIVSIFALHYLRKDKRFLKKITNNYIFVYFVEYLIIVIPFIIFFIILNKFILLLIIFPAIFLICLTNFSIPKYSLNNFIIRFIPSHFFEWKSGVRKNFIFLISLIILGLGLSFFVATVPIFLFLFTIIVSSFFQEAESRDIIEINNFTPKKFLFKKIKDNVLLYSLISALFIILFLIFHYKYWYIIVAEYIISVSIIVFSIVQKYSLYRPNISLKSHMVMVSIAQIGYFVPFIIPVIWVMGIYYFFKAKQNLLNYLS